MKKIFIPFSISIAFYDSLEEEEEQEKKVA